FITGGSQLKLSSALGGTEIAQTIRARHAAGMVVAGTSAGAALLSEHMIALGESGATPRRRLLPPANGLGPGPGLAAHPPLPPPGGSIRPSAAVTAWGDFLQHFLTIPRPSEWGSTRTRRQSSPATASSPCSAPER